MGNRAVITTSISPSIHASNDMGVYLHWNGGRDSVEAFLTFCKLKGYRAPEDDNYGWARLCQVIGNFFGDSTSIGVDRCCNLDCNNGDNGVYVIKNWEIVDRKYIREHFREQTSHDLHQMLMDINAAQPAKERLEESKIDAYFEVKAGEVSHEPCYILKLWDPATPAFCSATKMYIGTEEEIRAIAEAMAGSNTYANTANAIHDYWNGNYGATHNIAYCEIPVLQEAVIIDSAEIVLDNFEWEHSNTWECAYNLRCDSATVNRIIVQHETQYYRCLRVCFTNLCYGVDEAKMLLLNSGFWGNACILETKDNPDGSFTISNCLYVVEQKYETEEEAKAGLQDSATIDFKAFCDEIFGDG